MRQKLDTETTPTRVGREAALEGHSITVSAAAGQKADSQPTESDPARAIRSSSPRTRGAASPAVRSVAFYAETSESLLCWSQSSLFLFVQEFSIFVKTPKPRQTRARLGNMELADEAELVSLAVG